MPYAQITRAQFRALLVERLGAVGPTFWRTAELNFLIQESLRFWQLATGFWKTRTTLTTVVTASVPQLWYQMPSAITSQMRVSWQGYPLSPSSTYDLDFGRPAWTSETTASGGDVPARPLIFAIGGLNLIALWPSDAVGNSMMTIDGLASTPILTSDSSLLDIGTDEQKVLLDYCQHVATFKEGGKEFSDSQALMKNFMKAAGERSAIFRASATYRKWMGLDKSRWSKPMIGAAVEQGAR